MDISISLYKGFLLATVMNVLNILSTFYVTPDLADEGNYWVRNHSFGWVGLIFVLIFFQILYLIPFYFHTELFKTPVYRIRKNNSFTQVLKIYFFSDSQAANGRKVWIQIFHGLLNYAGYYGIRFYLASKLLAITDNMLMGLLLKKTTLLGETNGVKNISIDGTLSFWSSNFGKFIMWYSQFDPATKVSFQNKLLLAFGTIVLAHFVIKNYRKAISTPLDGQSLKHASNVLAKT